MLSQSQSDKSLPRRIYRILDPISSTIYHEHSVLYLPSHHLKSVLELHPHSLISFLIDSTSQAMHNVRNHNWCNSVFRTPPNFSDNHITNYSGSIHLHERLRDPRVYSKGYFHTPNPSPKYSAIPLFSQIQIRFVFKWKYWMTFI